MMVVAIIGVLASIAIPAFQQYQLRSKFAERSMMMTAHSRAVLQMIADRDGFMHNIFGFSWVFAPPNPPAVPSPLKHTWNQGLGDWRYLISQPSAPVYFQYTVWGFSTPGFAFFYVEARSDLDGDGIFSDQQQWWYQTVGTGGWVRWTAADFETGPGIM
jgi:hypothetical protein